MPWVEECVRRHRKRHDFRKLLMEHGLTASSYEYGIAKHDYTSWEETIYNIAADAAQRIYEGCLDLKKPTITTRADGASGKIRQIGCESAMQQVFDFIAVNASMPVFERRMVAQQASSVEGRGQIYGVRLIRRWAMKNAAGMEYAERHGYHVRNRMKYFVKLDVEHCFQSCRMEVFLRYFEKDCGNRDVIWLWAELFQTHRIDPEHQGFMIGALTSQWAAQYLLSFAYRFVMDHKETRRDGRQVKPVTHMVMFMDDMMLCGPNRRALMRTVEALCAYMRGGFGLTIKPCWQIQTFDEDHGIDMMGYVVYPSGKVEIRARDWVKIRRMFIRAQTQKYKVSYKQAKRLTSYKGYIIHSDSKRIKRMYPAAAVFRAAAKTVSNKEKEK